MRMLIYYLWRLASGWWTAKNILSFFVQPICGMLLVGKIIHRSFRSPFTSNFFETLRDGKSGLSLYL